MHTSCCKCLTKLIYEESWYGLYKSCFKEWFGLPEASQFLDLIVRSQSQAPQENQAANISFFNGAYRKYSARLGEIGFILKIQQKEYPELPATEFLCNQIYESLNSSLNEVRSYAKFKSHWCRYIFRKTQNKAACGGFKER